MNFFTPLSLNEDMDNSEYVIQTVLRTALVNRNSMWAPYLILNFVLATIKNKKKQVKYIFSHILFNPV